MVQSLDYTIFDIALRERLPLQRGASPHTCESYAYTFQLLFEFASNQHKVTPSKLYLEQIDSVLVMDFLAHIEATRDNGARTRNARLAAITPRTGGDPPFGGTRFSKRGGRANDPTLARYVLGPL